MGDVVKLFDVIDEIFLKNYGFYGVIPGVVWRRQLATASCNLKQRGPA